MDRQVILEMVKKAINASGNIGKVRSIAASPIGGGSINLAWKVECEPTGNFFLKVNSAQNFPQLFARERDGLEFLASVKCIRVPRVALHWEEEGLQVLLLEWIDEGNRTPAFWKKFGEQIAMLHHQSNDRFGFDFDNHIGSLPQSNDWHTDWLSFFEHCRLRPQVKLARENGYLDKTLEEMFNPLYRELGSIFSEEKPSLLHGDLWSGNFLCTRKEEPVLVDPDVYFGHRSMDLAMTKLFGGFYKDFYSAYAYHFPLPENHALQWEVCNLYPLLVHLNLFGRAYLEPIIEALRKFR